MNTRHFKLVMLIMVTLMVTKMAAQTSSAQEKQPKPEKALTAPIKDLNANGVDDAKENLQTGKASTSKLRDQFVDANGDGICDNREQGLGFRRGKMESGKQTGRRQQGKQK